MKATVIFIALLAVFFGVCFLMNNTPDKLVTGRVSSIYEASTKEMVLKVTGIKGGFCLKSDFVKKLNLKELKQRLVGQQVTIHYKAAWTPLDPSSNKQVASIEIGETPINSEHE